MATIVLRRRRLRLPGRIARMLPRRFLANEDGAYAIEFAMVAIPFFALLLMIFEIAFMIFANQLLDNAVGDASRLIRTGQAHQNGFDKGAFKTQVCDRLPALFDCDGFLHVDVRTYATFGSAGSIKPPLNKAGDEIDETQTSYSHGGAGDIVVTRVYYEWPMINPLTGSVFADLANGRRLMASVAAFRNEPFPW